MLLIHGRRDPHSRFSHYLGELVSAEGFAGVTEIDIEALDRHSLAEADVVLLPRLFLTSNERQLLIDYVAQGGKLIAFAPHSTIAECFGLDPSYRSIATAAGYLAIDPEQPVTTGLWPEPVQIVVPASVWRLAASAELMILANLRDATNPALVAPGVVRSDLGRGEAVLFAYDLAHAVARLRQGDPAYTDVLSSGIDQYCRPHELFVHQLPPEQQHVPQADIHTALLARVIETLAPQLRIWYYPEAAERSVMVMTSDDDWSTIDQFETLLEGLRKREATCSFYIVPGTRVSWSLMDEWEGLGHTFSVHPALGSDHRAGPAPDLPQAMFVGDMIRENIERHRREFGREVRTTRNHAVRWWGYVSQARLMAELGVRLECNYVSVAPLTLGYLCGSGRTLRFVDIDGSLIELWQQPTAWTEECLIHPAHPAGAHWHPDHAIQQTEGLIQAAARRFYTPITINSHPVSFATYSSPLIEANWDTARAEGMRIVSADQWLDWTEARDQLVLESTGDGWKLRAPTAMPAVTLLFPAGTAPSADGAEATTQDLWGRSYDALTVRNLGAGEERTLRRATEPIALQTAQ